MESFKESFGGPYVEPPKILAWGTQRLAYVLSPLIDRKKVPKKLNSILKECDKWAKNKQRTGHLELYKDYHQNLKDELGELRGKDILFMTGRSVDRTPEDPLKKAFPNVICQDYYSHSFLLSEKLLEITMQEYLKTGKNLFENYAFVVVSPVIFIHKIEIEDGFPVLRPLCKNAITKANEKAKKAGKKIYFGTLEKRLESNDPQRGNYDFSEILYLTAEAGKARKHYDASFIEKNKLFVPQEIIEKVLKKPEKLEDIFTKKEFKKTISKSVQANRAITRAAFENGIIKPLSLEQLPVYAAKTSYVFEIFNNSFWKNYRKINIDAMCNVQRSKYRESDDAALRRLVGYVVGKDAGL